MLKKILLIIVSLFFSLSIYAWNYSGHELIAYIAWTNMSNSAKSLANTYTIMLLPNESGERRFLDLSYWADSLRNADIDEFDNWHFIDQGFSDDGASFPPAAVDNVVTEIGQLEKTLVSNKPTTQQKSLAFVILLHLIGEAHQPLHCSDRFSAEHPSGDQGGNLFPLKPGSKTYGVNNLHALWDEGVGAFPTNMAAQAIAALANKIMSQYSQNYFSNLIQEKNPAQWVRESFKIAEDNVYRNIDENYVPSSTYIETNQVIAEQGIALGGYRLAYTLNALAAGTLQPPPEVQMGIQYVHRIN